ncbi:MAG: aldehyde ferredoxin oxidoreductase family protein [Desulfobacteraceae bacterium]|nr:aldehyde ferredoxin oxidoreductase family protein [Desulfobacteraceae bacterium]
MAHGYMDNSLKIDLTSGVVSKLPISKEWKMHYLGGRGMGIRLLWEYAPKGVDPLSPANPLIFMTGPYTGTGVFSAFYNVTTRSPLTGTAASAHSGGTFGPALKRAGVDGLMIVGQSEKPVYLLINGGKVTICDASSLWGKDVQQTESMIKEKHGKVSSAVIGPGGENLIKYGCIMNDTFRAVGRGGAGAVMGAKKLKAVVADGKEKINIAHHDLFTAISRKGAKTSLSVGKHFARYGTGAAFDVYNQNGSLPSYHFRKGHYDEGEKINAEALKKNYFVRDQGCFNCPLKCANIHSVKSGPFAVEETEGPEYETLMAFGSLCGNSNLEAIIKASHMVNLMGIDLISAGVTIAFAMDLFEMGLLTEKDTDGLTLTFGNAEAMVEMITKIAYRQGFGDLLAQGSLIAGRKIGPKAEERVMQCLGQEFPGYEPRRSPGTGFSLSTSNRGADHLRACFYANEIFGDEFKDRDFADHMKIMTEKEDLMALVDSLVMCKFGQRKGQFTPDVVTELLEALTGFAFDTSDLSHIGERIYNLERLYNIREGIEEIALPRRIFTEPIEDAVGKTPPLDANHYEKAKKNYFTARSWDENGHPKSEKLIELSLSGLVS